MALSGNDCPNRSTTEGTINLLATMNPQSCSLAYRLMLFALFMVVYCILYVIPNFFSTQEAFQLPFLWIDRVVPLIPWSFLVYTSDYFVFIFAIFILSQKDEFHAFARLMFGILLVCGTFFYLYPTIYPRPEYPAEENRILAWVMQFVAAADTPRNCFPSMHVGLTAGATWALRGQGKRTLILFVVWSLAIFASTLTTKQHYFIDIIGGIGVMAVVTFLENRILTLSRLDNKYAIMEIRTDVGKLEKIAK